MLIQHFTQNDCRCAISTNNNTIEAKLTQTYLEEWVDESGVLEALTSKWLTEIEDPDEIADLLNWRFYSHTEGWYVRSLNPDTGKYAPHGQFKPSVPLELEGKPQKYFSFPKGKGIEPLFAPMVLELWIAIADRHSIPINNEDIDENREDLGFWT